MTTKDDAEERLNRQIEQAVTLLKFADACRMNSLRMTQERIGDVTLVTIQESDLSSL